MKGDATEEIKEQLKGFAAQYGPAQIVTAVVAEVNEDDTVVVELQSGAVIDDVRLRAVVNDANKVVVIPAINSTILIGRIEQSEEWVVIAISDVSGVAIEIGTVKFNLTATGFEIKKGNDTLRQAMIELIEAIEPILVLQGNNPNFVKLAAAKTKVQNILV